MNSQQHKLSCRLPCWWTSVHGLNAQLPPTTIASVLMREHTIPFLRTSFRLQSPLSFKMQISTCIHSIFFCITPEPHPCMGTLAHEIGWENLLPWLCSAGDSVEKCERLLKEQLEELASSAPSQARCTHTSH